MSDRMPRLMVLLSDEMIADIDELRRYEADIPPRTEEIRRLLGEAIEARKRKARRKEAA